MTTLTFLGAARTVTGSKYLVEHDGVRVLVDAGMFQGTKELRLRNWDPFSVPAKSLDAIVLTHAHLDHIGFLPRLVAQGFRGRVFCTPGTKDLAKLVLPDSARIQEEDARQANRHGYSKHRPALPLYSEADAWRALSQISPHGYGRPLEIARGVTIQFYPAGHLLGSSFILMTLAGGPRLLFGGDLGRYGRPVLPDPVAPPEADIVLVESTYGDRDHEPDDNGARLATIIRETAARGGRVVIPAFAIGRVEELLYWIRRLEDEKQIPVVPVYVDSPMAAEALEFYHARAHELDEDMRPASRDVSAFATTHFKVVPTPEQSKALTADQGVSIIISSSGMATGGRVLHHLKATLPDARDTVLFVGYQAGGTRGRDLVDGAPTVKIHGQMVPVRARIAKIDSMSAHAGRGEVLQWLRGLPAPPKQLFLVHGEPGPMDALKALIHAELGWPVQTPSHGDTVAL